MRNDYLLPLLYAGVCGVLFTLALLASAVVHNDHSVEVGQPIDLVGCGTPSLPEAVRAGKDIWNANGCGACHSKSMKADLTGPALGGVSERWADYPAEDLRSWIRNSQAFIATGHPRALAVWSDWKPTAMPNYTHLTDEEIDQLLAYIERD